jgi:hypothetical protein
MRGGRRYKRKSESERVGMRHVGMTRNSAPPLDIEAIDLISLDGS